MIVLASLTSARVSVFQDNIHLWADARIHAPLKPRPILNLAAAFINAGDLESARPLLDESARLARNREGWERDHSDDLIAANRAVIELRHGNQMAAVLLLAGSDSRPIHAMSLQVCQTFELCRNPPHKK